MSPIRAVVLGLAAAALTACSITEPKSGAEFVDRLHARFDNGVHDSQYHLFASGLDTSRPLGLLVYADGSGAEGFRNPGSNYLLDADGDDGLVAVARKHNMLLLTPVAPPPGCDDDGNPRPDDGDVSNCWFDEPTAEDKATWSSDLIHEITGTFDVDPDRIVVGGFSSGAQWATRYFMPLHGEEHSVDLCVAIGYGGAPAATPRFSDDFPSGTALAWDTGTADPAYSDEPWGSIAGYSWYTEHGFDTHATWPADVDHDRAGEFHLIMDREITRALPPLR